MIPITSENAQILLSRIDTKILLKSDLEYVHYFIKLMEGFIYFSIVANCNREPLIQNINTFAPNLMIRGHDGVIWRLDRFIYFLQIEIYEILEKLSVLIKCHRVDGYTKIDRYRLLSNLNEDGRPILAGENLIKERERYHDLKAGHDKIAMRSVPYDMSYNYDDNKKLKSNVLGLSGEFRYKFNRIDDIYKFMTAIELYLINQK